MLFAVVAWDRTAPSTPAQHLRHAIDVAVLKAFAAVVIVLPPDTADLRRVNRLSLLRRAAVQLDDVEVELK